MFECELPFDHKTLHLELEDKNFAGVMEGHQNEFKTTKSQEELVEESLANPYGSPSLEELCAGKKDIVIISSDHTRPVPSRVTMPILLHHIHSAAPEARVRILVATGMHRPSTHEELVNKYGEEIVANEEIVMHVATDDSMMKKIGTLPSGGECIINKIAVDCDLLLAEVPRWQRSAASASSTRLLPIAICCLPRALLSRTSLPVSLAAASPSCLVSPATRPSCTTTTVSL